MRALLARYRSAGYHPAVLFRLGRRALYSGVAFFALLGFISVPIGEKTGWAHVQAIAATPAAAQAIDDIKSSAEQLQHRLVGWLTTRLHGSSEAGAPPVASAPEGPSDGVVPHTPKKKLHTGSTPTALPPKLSP